MDRKHGRVVHGVSEMERGVVSASLKLHKSNLNHDLSLAMFML